ncbi:MAG: protein-L-isoaspartate(D-aspartate) O-methyltransferase, partial [Pseudonocardiales bacterium]|nr:protein-L-isoaspartate(D-aspartate) O-methyltransferase [Pseudonocardiales bacterium]
MAAADRDRARLVDGLRDGVLRTAAGRGGRQPDPAIEEAFRAVPRHLFLPGVPVRRAYADEAVAVQAVDGVTTSSASQPSMVAIMLGQLDLRPGHRVLEIGAGTGYNAALMARIVGPDGRVVTVDIDADLVDGAARHLADAGVDGVELICADGALGYAPAAPYDRIVLTVGSGDVRPEWVAQLAPGGRLLLPLAVRGTQLSVALDLGDDHVLRSASVNRCAFVRLRGLGAVPEDGVSVDGLVLLPADERPVPARVVDAALSVTGRSRPAPPRLGAGDLWDGFGLWLALTAPGTCRLVAPPGDPDDPVSPGHTAELLRLTPGGATVGLLAEGSDGPGLAALVLEPDPGGSWRVHVQAFGPAGEAAA